MEWGFLESDTKELEMIANAAYGQKLNWIYENDMHGRKQMLRSLFMYPWVIVARVSNKIVGYCLIQCHDTPCNWKFLQLLKHQRNFRTMWLAKLNYSPRQEEVYIHMLAVHPEHRGNGIGSMLLQQVYTYSKQRGIPFVSLHVTFENVLAQKLYLREGFKEEESEELYCCLQGIFDNSFSGRILMKKFVSMTSLYDQFTPKQQKISTGIP